MRKEARRAFAVPILLFTLLSMQGCGFFNSLFGLGSKDEPKGEEQPAVVTIYTVDAEMAKSLAGKGFTAAEAAAIQAGADAASKAVVDQGALATDIGALLDVAVGGAVGSLESSAFQAWDDDKRLACVDAILAGYVAGMKGRFEATGLAARNARVLSDSALAVSRILARISKAAVANLAKTGISAERRGEAAGAVVGTMIGSLADGGVNKVLVNSALGSITQAAVESLKAAGLATETALATAVQSVTKGAVTAVASIAVEGVAAADYPALAQQIAKGAAAGVDAVATTKTEVSAFAGAIAAGAAEGVVEVKKAVATVSADTCLAMAQSVTSGATEGIMASKLVTDTSDGAGLISAITEKASATLSGAAATIGVTDAQVLAQVATGAAAAAQTAISGGLDAATLAAAITLKDAAGAAVATSGTEIQTAIASGIVKGNNRAPVADGGGDQTVEIGKLATLDASLSYDPDEGETASLTFAWSLTAKPATAQVTLATPTTGKTSFTPQVAGSYIVSLVATDARGKSAEILVTIKAVASASSATYLGKTAAERLASADSYMGTLDWPLARDELLLVLTRYPESSVTPEATFKLAKCHQKLKAYPQALARFTEVLDKYETSAWLVPARIEIGFIRLNNIVDAAAAKVQFDAVAALDLQDALGAAAVEGQGLVALKSGDLAGGRTLLAAAIARSGADLNARFYSKKAIADSYWSAKDYAGAIAQYQEIAADADRKYSYVDATTRDYNLVLTAMSNIAWIYGERAQAGDEGLLRSQFAAVREDASFAPWMRLQAARNIAERWLWNDAATEASCDQARAILEAALPLATESDILTKSARAWARLRLGQAYSELARNAKTVAEKDARSDAAIAALDLVAAEMGSYWGSRQAGEALVEKAGVHLWRKNDNAKAEEILKALIPAYPAEYDQYPVAAAYYRLGETYQDWAWDTENAYGKDYEAYFYKAISAFSKVKPELYAGVSKTQWFFYDAPIQIGICYSGLAQYDAAIAKLTPILDATSTHDASDKAWAQLAIAEAMDEKLRRDYIYKNKFDDPTLQPLALSLIDAYTKVSDYKSPDGSFVDNGEHSAQAWTELARLYKDCAQQMKDSGYANTAVIAQNWQTGADTYAKVTWDAYASVDKSRWFFYEALASGGYCLESLGKFDLAKAKYNAALEAITNGNFQDSKRPILLYNIARVNKSQADALKNNATNKATRVALYKAAIDDFVAIIDTTDRNLDGGLAAAKSAQTALGCYNKLMGTENLSGWANADPATLKSYVDGAAAIATKSDVFKNAAGALVGDGSYAAWGMGSYGWVLYKYGQHWEAIGDQATATAKYLAAAAAFKAISTYAGADIDSLADGWTNYGMCYQAAANASRATIDDAALFGYLEEAVDAANIVIAMGNPDPTYAGYASMDAAWMYMDFGSRLATAKVSADFTDDYWKSAARIYFTVGATPEIQGLDIDLYNGCVDGLAQLDALAAPAPATARRL